jgi:hypothetical protein
LTEVKVAGDGRQNTGAGAGNDVKQFVDLPPGVALNRLKHLNQTLCPHAVNEARSA